MRAASSPRALARFLSPALLFLVTQGHAQRFARRLAASVAAPQDRATTRAEWALKDPAAPQVTAWTGSGWGRGENLRVACSPPGTSGRGPWRCRSAAWPASRRPQVTTPLLLQVSASWRHSLSKVKKGRTLTRKCGLFFPLSFDELGFQSWRDRGFTLCFCGTLERFTVLTLQSASKNPSVVQYARRLH